MASNFTLPTNLSQPHELFTTYANDVTGGLFGTFILLMIFFVAFISMQRFENFKSPFTAASFVTMILAIFFRTLELIPDWVMFVSIFMVVGGLASLLLSKE